MFMTGVLCTVCGAQVYLKFTWLSGNQTFYLKSPKGQISLKSHAHKVGKGQSVGCCLGIFALYELYCQYCHSILTNTFCSKCHCVACKTQLC